MPKTNSGLFSLNYKDFAQSAVAAVFAAVLVVLIGVVNQPNFNVFTLDWGLLGSHMVNKAIFAFVAFLGTQFVTADNGKIMGRFL